MKTKTNMNRARILAVIFATTFIGWVITASAEPPPPERPERPLPPDAARRERPPGNFQRPGPPDQSLSEEQRTAIRETMEASRKEAAPFEEKMRAARRELQEAIHAEKVDEQVIRDKAAEVGKLEGDLAVIRAKAFAKIRPSLTPEQLARMKNMRPEFDRQRPPFAEGRPGEPRRRGEGFDGPPGRPLPPGEDRGPDGTLPPPPKPRPPE